MTDKGKPIKIQAYKYNNRLHYEWESWLLEQTDRYILVLSPYGRKLTHYSKGQIFEINRWTLEYFSFHDWFTVSADLQSGRIDQYYCNINQPAVWKGPDAVSFVDLDLDYIQQNGVWRVVDEDEFERHRMKFGYDEELIQNAQRALADLKELVAGGSFPFDGFLERWIPIVEKKYIQTM